MEKLKMKEQMVGGVLQRLGLGWVLEGRFVGALT